MVFQTAEREPEQRAETVHVPDTFRVKRIDRPDKPDKPMTRDSCAASWPVKRGTPAKTLAVRVRCG